MEFKTTIPVHNSRIEIDHHQHMMLIGSCFSNEIGKKLDESGFNVMVNPFGTLFNPISISESLGHIVRNTAMTNNDFFEQNGIWLTYKAHSSFGNENLNNAIVNCNKRISEAHHFFNHTNILVLTLGTAWAYEYNKTGKIVAGCHKTPANEFTKRKLGVNEIISEHSHLIEHLLNINPKLKIIYTISPVKHLKDGFVENNWSKSTLNIAVHELIRRFECCDYYPAFEIQQDDLRDYRFYKSDLVHPNELATEYIYDHFKRSFFSAQTNEIANEFYQLHKATRHKVFNRESEEFKKFTSNISQRAEKLRSVNAGKADFILNHFSA